MAIGSLHTVAFGQPGAGRLVDALRAAGRLLVSLGAEEEEHVVGQVAFCPVTVGGVAGGLGLGPLAVLPDRGTVATELTAWGSTTEMPLGAG